MIISADAYNRSSLRTVTVAVLTTNARLAALPGNVEIPADVAGLTADSVVNVTEIATVDRSALGERIGGLPDWLMIHVDAGLTLALAVGRTWPTTGELRPLAAS